MNPRNVGNFVVESFEIEGLMLISPKILRDPRGFFTERLREDLAKSLGLPHFVQENFSRSDQHVLRGLHYQFQPAQGKLVTVTRGEVLDVAVDIRFRSKTFGQHITVTLQSDKPQWLWMPAGFAHGFYVISKDGADLLYKVDNYYGPGGEGSLLWNDPSLGIDWKQVQNQPLLSGKDESAMLFSDYKKNPKF